MTWFVGQSLVIIAAAFVLGVGVGWLIWGARRVATSAAPVSAAPKRAASLKEEPAAPVKEAPPAEKAAPAVKAPAEKAAVKTLAGKAAPAEKAPAEKATPAVKAPAEVAAPVEAELVAPAEKAAAKAPVEKAAPAQKSAAKAPAKAKAAAPAKEEQADDDLKRIEGIGPRMSGALKQAGIRTYQQLAEADEAALRAAIEAAGLKFAPSLVTWSRQARLLADGDEEGFADLTRRLVAGRDEARP